MGLNEWISGFAIFFILELDGGECSDSLTCRLTPQELDSRSGRYGVDKNVLSLTGIERHYLVRSARSLVVIQTELSLLARVITNSICETRFLAPEINRDHKRT
jgi:hypothetical protein